MTGTISTSALDTEIDAPQVSGARLSASVNSLSPRQSSAEYVATGIKQHKLAVIMGGAVIVIGIVVVAAYLRMRSSPAGLESIAVLPFVNTSGDATTDYLADGITESLINNFSQFAGLRVVPRSTIFRYKGQQIDPEEIGHKLGVRAVLTGRVVQRGDIVNIQTELIDVDKSVKPGKPGVRPSILRFSRVKRSLLGIRV